METVTLDNKELIIQKSHTEPIIIMQHKDAQDIIVKENVKATILELFVHPLNHHHKNITLEKNASLELVRLQDLDETFNSYTEFFLENNAYMQLTNLEFGKASCQNNYKAQLKKEEAHLEILGLVKLFSETNNQSTFNIEHYAKNSSSNLHYKHLLHDFSKAVFQANSVVNNSALYSKAFQNCNTLLLSDDATIFAQPHLEILIDELQASHGATVGGLDEEALLYLQSRGISKKNAQLILLKAFENEIYDNINSSKLKTFIKEYKRGDYV